MEFTCRFFFLSVLTPPLLTALVAEIKEIKENMQKEDDMLLAVAAGNKRPLVPHLEYEYPDTDIHEDLYKLMKYSCEEVCSKGQLNKIMKLWTTFLEPMLRVTSRSHVAEGVEDVKARQRTARHSAGSVAERVGSPAADNPRQSKSVVNGDENLHADASKSSRANGDAMTKDGSYCESDAICREDSSSNVQPKMQTDIGGVDRVPERLHSSSSSPHNSAERRHGRSNMEPTSGLHYTMRERITVLFV